MGNLALSADGEIKLYEVSKTILESFDDLLEQFFEWKTTNCYDEQLFVKFLQGKLGKGSVKFIKNLGYRMPKEYKHILWYNF